MKIVVDTNIVFSAMLNRQSRISEILIDSEGIFRFYSTSQLLEELEKHEPKLLKLTGLSPARLHETRRLATAKIRFIQLDMISDEHRLAAQKLVAGIDEDDEGFVAAAEFLNAKLWTGDKKLLNGLRLKGWPNALSTDEIFQLRQQIELKSE